MTFDENETMNPDGTNISASQAKKMQNEIDALKETVSTLADAVTDFASETDTAQLRANKAAIVDADIANVEIEKAVVTDAEIGLLDATQGSIKTLESESIEADEADITDIDARTVTANSVNSASYTGVLVNVQGVKSNSGEIKAVTSQTTETDELTVNSDAEIKGALTQRGNINFPENGDIIQGEYLEFWGRNAKIKNLITQTPQDSTQLVGYDNNGNLIPVDGTLDPGNFWRNKEGEPGTIETKDDKGIDVADIACDDLTAEGDITVTGDITATGDVSCDNASVTTDATVGGDVTVSGDASVTGDISGDNITASGKVQGDNADFTNDVLIHGDLYVDGVEHVVQEENIVSQNDFITLRANNSASLGSKKSGLLINNYNGSDSLAVVTDGDGTLRVGTGVGTETTYNDIYFDSVTDKWYTDIEDPTSEVTPSGSLVEWASVSESGTVTHYVNAVFKVIDFSQGTLEPLLTREEDADLNDQGLLKYNHASEKADTLPLPTAPESYLKATVNNGNVSYSWENVAQNIFDIVHPVGEIYVQYPQQDDPNTLYAGLSTWTEIDYAGAFFRANGGNADSFKTKTDVLSFQSDLVGNFIATGSTTDTSKTLTGTLNYQIPTGGITEVNSGIVSNPTNSGKSINSGVDSSQHHYTATIDATHSHNVSVTRSGQTENRPVNYTVKIWKRTA